MNEIAVKSDPMADFQEKLRARVRDDIRDLLPEDAVSGLVKKAVEDIFFTPRKIPDPNRGSYSNAMIDVPSWFVEEVTKAAKPIMEKAVAKCVADNPAAVEKVIYEFLDANRLAVMTSTRLNDLLSGAIYSLQQNMRR